MKTKNKILATVEIAIVLCSVFLLALPAIAAASEIYEHGPLDVFGNANEDDTIDMRDTTYIKLVIFGKKPKTDLSDANYDGKVSMLDVGQTKLIILGKEKKLTYIDIFGEAETVNKPIERLAQLGLSSMQVTRMLGAWDIIVCVASPKGSFPLMYPDEISKLPAVGNKPDICDHEMILSLMPNAVMTNLEAKWALIGGLEQKRMFEEKLPGIPIISLNMREMDTLSENVRTYGYILDREDEAEEFIDWYEGYYNVFKSRTEELSEDEKPRVIYENDNKPYQCIATGSRFGQALFLAGGYNIVDEIVGPDHPQYGTITVDVDPEWVIEQNPEIIFIRGLASRYGGYGTDDPSEFVALRQKIFDRPELANVDAVKNKCVYVLGSQLLEGAGCGVIGIAYMGKLFQSDRFTDIDPQAVHQEYVDKFCHIDFDVRKHGVFFYPPIEEW
nr:putative iron(iii) ABC transporter, solute-binding protein [uncultured archaeon]